MFQDLLRRGVGAVRRRTGMRPRVVSHRLLGRDVQVTEGSIRDSADYDDAWFLACARHAEVIFDVGANLGHMAVVALMCPDVKRVVLIEPNSEALAIGAENLIRNQLSTRATFVCAFVSNLDEQTVRLWTVGAGAAGSMYAGHAVTASGAGRSIEVPTVTVDRLVDALGFHPDLVKIDVEGAEGLVLQGARRCAEPRLTRFLVEMHSNPELSMADNTAGVLGWCRTQGYAAWYLARGTRLEGPEEVRQRGRCHFLLQPADWPYPPWLVGIPQSAPLASVPITAGD